MTTREAIAIVRDYAPILNDCPRLRDAILTVATIAEHHAERNRKNKRRQRARITDFAPGGATASASNTASERADRDGAGAEVLKDVNTTNEHETGELHMSKPTKSTDTPRQRKRGPRKFFMSDGVKMPSLHNMSPVRKRIELRRRAAAEYYAICGVQA